MLASSAFVLAALTMTGVYMKGQNVESKDDGYTLDFTALENNADDKMQEISEYNEEHLLKEEENIPELTANNTAGNEIAASVWSLLIPAIEMAEQEKTIAWIPASVGFLLGMGFLLLLDTITPHLHFTEDEPEGIPSHLKKTTMLVLAVTLHNIPEGMAVGVTFAGVLTENTTMSMTGAFALAIGIAIQNFPEGAIISMPLQSQEISKTRAFVYGTLSGIVEPVGAFLTILLTGLVVPLLPYLLSFAAGAMIYVVVEELIPEAQSGEHSNISTIGVAAGFVLMMILDVALG